MLTQRTSEKGHNLFTFLFVYLCFIEVIRGKINASRHLIGKPFGKIQIKLIFFFLHFPPS